MRPSGEEVPKYLLQVIAVEEQLSCKFKTHNFKILRKNYMYYRRRTEKLVNNSVT